MFFTLSGKEFPCYLEKERIIVQVELNQQAVRLNRNSYFPVLLANTRAPLLVHLPYPTPLPHPRVHPFSIGNVPPHSPSHRAHHQRLIPLPQHRLFCRQQVKAPTPRWRHLPKTLLILTPLSRHGVPFACQDQPRNVLSLDFSHNEQTKTGRT